MEKAESEKLIEKLQAELEALDLYRADLKERLATQRLLQAIFFGSPDTLLH